ncbi:restriction endonuclease subunit S [Lacticaseibacillus paracasei]|uniref:restriction endonuclease subunit S n=1 Tax=Lacticaseibacillus paracasei TaxID=1597 RepID=UPI000FED1925|nr:restriction endonuclease subunit S [Lacticaseibacillus paracasei]RND60910.1 EcoKI restriction-modification system protein HsdS [Lacticaseibacillus paracasei]
MLARNAWEKRKLGELANIRRGASPRPIKSKKWFSQTSQVGWIRISDVTEQNGRIHQVEQHLSDAGQKKTLVLKSKHLLLSIAATVGKPVQNYIQVGVHDGFIVFMDPKFDLDFMFYFLEKYRPNWARFGQPGSQININSELVRDLVVSIPTVHEQDAVAQFIITLDNLIAATQDKIGALEQVKETLSKNLFDQSWRFKEYSTPWKENKLKDIVSAYSGGTPSANIRTYYGGHIPFIRSAEIHSSTTALTLTQEGLKNSSAKLVKTGDILYALYGANSGDVDRSKINGAINQAILAMRPSKENDSNFILFQLMRMKNKIVSTYLQGGQGNLSGRIILALNLDMPESTSEQRTIGRSLQLLCELISVNQSKYSQLESLKKSLLQNLFV